MHFHGAAAERWYDHPLGEECVVGHRVFSNGKHNHLRVDLSSTGRVRLAETNCDGLFVEQMAVTHVQKDGRGTNKESALAEDVLSRNS